MVGDGGPAAYVAEVGLFGTPANGCTGSAGPELDPGLNTAVCTGTVGPLTLGLAAVTIGAGFTLVVDGERFAAGARANGGSFPWKSAMKQPGNMSLIFDSPKGTKTYRQPKQGLIMSN